MSAIADLAKVSKQQGIAAAIALALVAALMWVVRAEFKDAAAQRDGLAMEVDAIGDLVISACGANTAQVQKFEEAKRTRIEKK
jgi:hypothetical protein